MSSKLIRNALRTPDGTIIESRNRHDYVAHLDQTTNRKYFIAGGFDYVRSSCWGDEEFMTVYSDESHEVIRENLIWGSKAGLVRLSEMDTSHIEACLDTVPNMLEQFREAMVEELDYRLLSEEAYIFDDAITDFSDL